jgi:hypothetical protein
MAGPIRSPARLALLAALVLALMGGVSLRLGQDLNFDLLNYHYYAGYAFLHGRTFRDLAPAGSQSFLPPLLHVFSYLGIAYLPPRLFGFLLGAIHGLNVLLLFALGLVVHRRDDPRRAWVVSILATVVGSLGPAAVSLLGTTFGDNLVSIPAALALVLVLATGADASPRRASWRALAAGLLGGAAAGLKLPMAVYQLALLVAAGVLWWSSGSLAKRLGMLSLGSLLGYMSTGGFWAIELQRRFGNPVFPFANDLFRSEYQTPKTGMVERFSYGLVRPILDMALGRPGRLAEIEMRDVRFLLLLVAGIGCAAVWLVARARGARRVPWSGCEWALLVWWLTGYVAWGLLLSTYRYATLLEFTAPLVLFLLLRRLASARHAPSVVVVAALLIIATTRSGSWGRRAWQSPWLRLTVPALGQAPNSLILMVGQPSAFAIPSFRADARFVHLTGVERFRAPAKWGPLVEQAVREQRGPLLLLSNFEFSRAECEARAAALGLRTTSRCEPISNGSLRFRLCELEREQTKQGTGLLAER